MVTQKLISLLTWQEEGEGKGEGEGRGRGGGEGESGIGVCVCVESLLLHMKSLLVLPTIPILYLRVRHLFFFFNDKVCLMCVFTDICCTRIIT